MGCLARKCAIRSFSGVSGRSSHRMRPRGPVFGASNSHVRRTRKGILRVEIPGSGKYPQEYPRPRKYPPEYPRSGLAKSPAISRTCEKYPQYPQYPRPHGDILRGAYTHKETLNFTLLIYIYEKAKSPASKHAWGFWGYWGYFQETKQACGFAGF